MSLKKQKSDKTQPKNEFIKRRNFHNKFDKNKDSKSDEKNDEHSQNLKKVNEIYKNQKINNEEDSEEVEISEDDLDIDQEDNRKKFEIENKFDSLKDSIKHQLTEMSFEEVMKLQNKLGLKKFKEVVGNNKDQDDKIKNFTRLNKNRPQEISSKKKIPFHRNIFQVKKKEIIDPRFSSAFGEYKPDLFRKSYSFVNDMRKKEKEMLGEQFKEEEDPEKKSQIKSALLRLRHQIKSFEDSEKKEKINQDFKKRAVEDAKNGKKPHYLNKSEEKILQLADKYRELKKSGKIENYLAKKRKKQLSKDSKQLKRNEHLRFI